MAITAAHVARPARIRLGMVGGGRGAFIGAVHRIAARIDDQFELVAGAFSSDPDRSAASAADLGVARSYGSFAEMAAKEARRKDGIEAVAIVTPNHMHAPVALQFLKRGIHVICDKPLTATLPEAKRLAKAATDSGVVFALTHNYTGYPMIRQAKAMVSAGDLGEIRLVQVEYAQDWLAMPLEGEGNKQADWRTDPARSGAGGSTGDIGTHAFNLANFVSGLTLQELAADLQSFVPGRRVDDNGHVLLRYTSGARGMLWCSQVASGQENGLRLRIYGTKAGIEWEQENPNYLWVTPLGAPRYRLTRGGAGSGEAAARVTRTPAGHPEGYLEGFANIYAEAGRSILARREGVALDSAVSFPGLKEGLEGVAFVDACVRSSARNGAWTKLAL
ncbi:MAG: oxidoreductase domain-containing protein [Rhodobacteraceae bacterium]|uniref:Gfo/Idh/MocA family protein n=1 Tax=Cypionkella sp. TaxID=2811411 RepID=UPI00132708AD|nr:Gfo/Idh/MocA family oxidoreductase [Cypionkella sp.]KAF0172483.1 MAG: oxidoreductase domain-containing protein [Paracoccaceae bacterium]MDO8327086.1 Gfo/Idh/MocA family oxidoreductase [Cypionkella sp.]